MTGVKQFSLFTGWLLANNALYVYEYCDTAKQLSAQEQELDIISQQFYGMMPKNFRRNFLIQNPGSLFVQYPFSPLKQYMTRHYVITNNYSLIVAWGKASVVFEKYGIYLIKNNPGAFIHYFLFLNLKNYFIPHLEKLEIYNLGQESVDPIASFWFHYKTDKISAFSKRAQGFILYLFPLLFMAINLYYLICALLIWIKDHIRQLAYNSRCLFYISITFLFSNLVFCVFATIIVLRYEVMPMIICLATSLLMTEWVFKRNKIYK